MCLIVISRDSSEVKGKTFFKTLKIQNGNLSSVYEGFIYKPGITVAKDSKDEDSAYVDGSGIHLWTTIEAALKDCDKSDSEYNVIVPFTCYKKDFIAIGNNGDIAFSKVFLSKERYEKALKAPKNGVVE